jgi:hypothetical protein
MLAFTRFITAINKKTEKKILSDGIKRNNNYSCNDQQEQMQLSSTSSSFLSLATSGKLAAFATTSFCSNKLKKVMN